MSTETKLVYLKETKEEIKSAIEYKGVTVPSSTPFRGYASLIRKISSGGGSSPDYQYPVMEVPEEYLSYVEYARENLYTGSYKNLVVWDSGEWIAVSFLMGDFSIESFDPITTEVKAAGWFTCGYVKSTGTWTSHDYHNTVSPGGNYAKHIVFASCPIEYGGETLFPVGITTMAEVSNIEWDDANLSANIHFVNGEVVPLTWTEDAEGNATSITIDGHTITSTGVV